jgi:hypothetical protein
MDDNKNVLRSKKEKETMVVSRRAPALHGEKSAKENLYDKIPLTVKQLDIILVLCAAAIFIAFVLGILDGKGAI